MHSTNADYFSFNVHHSAFITGQTGSGKTEFVRALIQRMQGGMKAHDVSFVVFDPKQVEFSADQGLNPIFDFEVVKDQEQGLDRLEELARLSSERLNASNRKPMIFIYIDECDMAAIDQQRFDQAVITINTNAKQANMKLIYGTSRPAPDVVSKELLASFDLLLTAQLASEADAKHLGVAYGFHMQPFSFMVTEKKDTL